MCNILSTRLTIKLGESERYYTWIVTFILSIFIILLCIVINNTVRYDKQEYAQTAPYLLLRTYQVARATIHTVPCSYCV